MDKSLNFKTPSNYELSKRLPYWHDWARQKEKASNFIKELKPDQGARILEVGCGKGHFLALLAVNGFDVCGIDPNEESIDCARRLLIENNLSVDKINKGKAEKLPFPDSSIDCVVSFQVLEHVENLEKTFLEIERVLKPGGKTFHTAPNYNSFFEGHLLVPILPAMNEKIFKMYLKFIKFITFGMYKRASWPVIDSLNPIKVKHIREINNKLKELELSVKDVSELHVKEGRLVIPSRSYIHSRKQSLSRKILVFGIDVLNTFGLGEFFYKLMIRKEWYPSMEIVGIKSGAQKVIEDVNE